MHEEEQLIKFDSLQLITRYLFVVYEDEHLHIHSRRNGHSPREGLTETACLPATSTSTTIVRFLYSSSVFGRIHNRPSPGGATKTGIAFK